MSSSPPTPTLTHLPISSPDPTHFVHIISNLLSPSECASIISTHTNLSPSNLTPGTIRTRETFTDEALAARLWSRMEKFYKGDRIQDADGVWWTASGLNPGLRLSKYEKGASFHPTAPDLDPKNMYVNRGIYNKGGKFTPHFDYSRQTSVHSKSFLSVNIYLNSVAEADKGATRILKNDPLTGPYWDGRTPLTVLAKIQPVQGSASVFRETLWHDGEELLRGEKYLLRSDVLYEREGTFDFDELYGELSDDEQAEKAAWLADALVDGGAEEEAERCYERAAFLCPAVYFRG
ncbi:hypothetical protein LSUE1_G009840 [Lachnellula suecica]|uniref:Prolyl 4-hydroxylase alpha subunit domain-containing protein n=1 Tax=Lachnellula suecica TaxID=602035 RepID=A0A8T9BVE8_9HELO|nr:hypothetical protein LSUE1_G009840 [Lachnellula suecica]